MICTFQSKCLSGSWSGVDLRVGMMLYVLCCVQPQFGPVESELGTKDWWSVRGRSLEISHVNFRFWMLATPIVPLNTSSCARHALVACLNLPLRWNPAALLILPRAQTCSQCIGCDMCFRGTRVCTTTSVCRADSACSEPPLMVPSPSIPPFWLVVWKTRGPVPGALHVTRADLIPPSLDAEH